MFAPQKVQHLKNALKLKNPKLSGHYMATVKKDGWFNVIPYTQTRGWESPLSFSSPNKTWRTIPSLEWTPEILNKLSKPNFDCFLIPEVTVSGVEDFHIANGILNRSTGDYHCKEAFFSLHDIIIPDQPGLTAIQRWNILQQLDTSPIEKYMEKLPLLGVHEYNPKLWTMLFEQAINEGEEGICWKQVDSVYQFGKRNSSLLKEKLECEVDALAIRLEEGIGEKGNDSLTLVSKRKNGIEIRTVISKHKDKELFRSNPNEVLGKVVTIRAMSELEDGNLRQPVFRWIRYDKQISEID